MECFNVIVRASMIKSTNFGIDWMLNLNTIWKLPKLLLIKGYEQTLAEIFYFTSPIFVEHLRVIQHPYEFFWNL